VSKSHVPVWSHEEPSPLIAKVNNFTVAYFLLCPARRIAKMRPETLDSPVVFSQTCGIGFSKEIL
jgi:hypothetical protein